MSLLARPVSDIPEGWVGSTVPQAPRKEKIFLHGVWVLVYSYLRVRCDLPISINFRDISGFPKLRSPNPVLKVTLDGPKWWYVGFYGYDFLLVINCTRNCISQAPFPKCSLRHVQRRYIWLPLLCLNPRRGFPWDNLRQILQGGQRMASVQNGVKILSKISTGWVGCTNVGFFDSQCRARLRDHF